ncbi:hypothetical protein ACE6H2_000671 [Prunus campanulata]
MNDIADDHEPMFSAEEKEPIIQTSTSQPSRSGLASKVLVPLSFSEEELEKEGEIPLTRKRKVPDAKLPSNDSIEIKVRPSKGRKLILHADEREVENNQVVPPIQATTTAAETYTPTSQTTCIILSQGEVSSRVSAPSSSSAAQGIAMPVVENSAVGRTILQVLKSTDEACKPIVAELQQLLTILETQGFKILHNLGLLFKIKSLF